jgi:hypothetical protein
MRHSKGLVVGLLMLSSAAVAKSGDRWMPVAHSVNRVLEVDTQTLQRSGPRVTVWERSRYKSTQSFRDGGRYDATLVQQRYDCDARTVTLLAWLADLQGNRVDSDDVPDYKQTATAIVPDSIGEIVLNAICTR